MRLITLIGPISARPITGIYCNVFKIKEIVFIGNLPWGLLTTRKKKMIADLWFWMKLCRENRVFMWSMDIQPRIVKTTPNFPDLKHLCNEVKLKMDSKDISISYLAEKVFGIKLSMLENMMESPMEWLKCDKKERDIYIGLMKWGTYGNDQIFIEDEKVEKNKNVDNKKVDTEGLAAEIVVHMLKCNIGFASISHAIKEDVVVVKDLVESPKIWKSTTEEQKVIYVKLEEWKKNVIAVENLKKGLKRKIEVNDGPAAKKQPRIIFTPEQKKGLKEAFAINAFPVTVEKEKLAEQFGLDYRHVSNFFCNMRRKIAQEGLKQKTDEQSNESVVSNHPQLENVAIIDNTLKE